MDAIRAILAKDPIETFSAIKLSMQVQFLLIYCNLIFLLQFL